MNFVDFLYRIKQELDLKQDKDVADFLELDVKAFSARKTRNSIPEKHLRAALSKHPELQVDVEYILTGKRFVENSTKLLGALSQGQNNPFAESIAQIHTRLNMPLPEIAEILCLTEQDLQQIVQGQISPPLFALGKLVTKFGIDAQYLLTGQSYPQANSQQPELSTDEQTLLAHYRQASDNGKFVINSVANNAEKKQ